MARASLILPHYTSNSHLIRTGLSLSLLNFTKVSIFSSLRKLKHVRFLCGCLAKKPNDLSEVEKHKDMFSKRMAMAGLQPHHRIAVGVSGGLDSMALCLLAANWKKSGLNATSSGKDDSVDGLLAIIVDHGLRAESKDEEEMVQCRVLNMGTKLSPLAVFGVKNLLEQEMVNVGSL